MSNDQILMRASMTDCLTARITENASAQQVDLNKWIFEAVQIQEGAAVLELCCGTGAQTKHMLARVGDKGRVVAVDVSENALSVLAADLPTDDIRRLNLIASELENLSVALEENKLAEVRFDLVFCAYGLYYSKSARTLLDSLKRILAHNGSIIIVGPFGRNNGFIFDFLEAHGVEIPTYVSYTSRDFMWAEVVPWATTPFRSTCIRTLTNTIKWKLPSNVMNYWQNSTFFDADKRGAVEAGLEAHFRSHQEFINEKCIMFIEMTDG